MRANELRKYKTLDITELSGSPWNNAEKVLGLDENDKVIMAEPDGAVTPEDVADAVNQAMEAETARTEDAYAKKDEIPDMEDYYTKEEVDEAISGITVDLSDYYTKDETDQAISAATQDLASTDYVDDAIAAIPEPDLSDYYTKDETDGAISTALVPYATKGWVSSQSYANQNYVMFKVNEAMQIETARTESTYAKHSDIPSLDDYATEQYVDNAVSSATQDMATEQYVNDAIAAIPGVDLSGYAKTTAVTQDIQTAIASETARTENTYAKPSQIPSLDGFATEEWVENQGYLTEHQDLSAYAKTTAVTEDIQTAMATETGRTEEVYAKKSEIPSLDGYATQAWTTGDTESRIASAMASETARTESTYLKEHQSLDDYYTKSQVDAEITGATEGLASEQYVNDAIAAIPAVDLSPYAKTTAVTQDIQTAMAAETARTESTYLKEHQSLDNYYTKSEVDADFVSAATSVGEAIDAAVQGLASEDYVNNAVSGLASEDYVDNAVTSATEGLASEEYVDNAVAGIDFPDDYATTGDVASAVEGLASESYVDDAITSATQGMATQSDLEGLASESYVDDAVNGVVQGIGMLGMVNDVSESNGTVTVQKTTMQEGQLVTGSTSFNIATPGDIQTAIASETARTESTYLKEHQSLDNYYTKSQVDAEITGATEDMATKTWVGQQGYLTQHQDLSAYAKTTAVTEDIASAIANETARTESTYAKPSQIPSLAGYATETYVDNAIASETARTESTYLKTHQDISGKLDKTDFNTYTGATATVLAGKLDATAYTIDNTIDSASTNPVENRAIYAALNGESVSTQIEISNVDSSVMVAFEIENSDSSQQSQIGFYLKETNIPGYYAIPTKTVVDCATTVSSPYYFMIYYLGYNNNYYTPNQDVQITENNLGTNIPFQNYSGKILYFTSDLDGTFEYYFVYNTDNNYGAIYKTLPSIETISDHKANVSDLPTAQDGSGFNQFVYNGSGDKRVLSNFSPGYIQNITSNDRQSQIRFNITHWGGSISQTYTGLPRGNECIDGVKTDRDSQVISKAEEALNGFTEQITLTLGNRSATEKINVYQDLYLYETNNPRYLAVPTSEAYSGYIQNVTLSGTTYYVSNPLFSSDNYRPVTGKYQLGTAGTTFGFNKSMVGNTYIIIDTELLTLEISDSLTITRAKSIPEAISAATQNMVTSGDVATQIDTAMASETARTESTYAKPSQIPSLSGYATETWVQNQGYLTQHQSLAEYYTKTEIDGMIGDIESLLASI